MGSLHSIVYNFSNFFLFNFSTFHLFHISLLIFIFQKQFVCFSLQKKFFLIHLQIRRIVVVVWYLMIVIYRIKIIIIIILMNGRNGWVGGWGLGVGMDGRYYGKKISFNFFFFAGNLFELIK